MYGGNQMMRGGGGPPMRGMMRGGPPMRGQGPPNFNGPRQFRPNMNHGGGGPGGGMGMVSFQCASNAF